MVLSFDALFGLPRKKAAGSSYRQPLHGSLMFGDQGEVDSFVAAYPKQKKAIKVRWSCIEYDLFSY